jgi:membrane-associated protease RseP (regulator of RpoE activity)
MKLPLFSLILSLCCILPATAQDKQPPSEAQIEIPYLGVATVPAPPPLTSQLKLQPGFGLLVVDVVKDSPAEAAGLQVNDVLVKLDDQQLIEPNQFAVLIRSHKPDDQVALTLIRTGETKTQQVKIGERPAPKNAMFEERLPGPMLIRQDGPQVAGAFSADGSGQKRRFIISRDEPGRPGPIGGQVSTMIVDGNKRFLLTTEPEGDVLIVSDQEKNQLFRGPVSTDEQRAKVPEEFRGTLKKMEGIRGNMPLSIPLPPPGVGKGIEVRPEPN